MRSKVILITIFCVHRDAGADTEEEFEIDVTYEKTENNNISGTFAFHNSEIEITDETGQNLVPAIQWSDAQVGKYLTNPISGIDRFPTLDEAKNKCLLTDGCVGVTMIPGTPSTYEIRSGPDLMTSGVGANSWTYSVQDPQITMKKGGKYSIKMDLKDDLTENCQVEISGCKISGNFGDLDIVTDSAISTDVETLVQKQTSAENKISGLDYTAFMINKEKQMKFQCTAKIEINPPSK